MITAVVIFVSGLVMNELGATYGMIKAKEHDEAHPNGRRRFRHFNSGFLRLFEQQIPKKWEGKSSKEIKRVVIKVALWVALALAISLGLDLLLYGWEEPIAHQFHLWD